MSLAFIEKTLDYVAEAVAELFSPNHDNYPSTGYQSFEDEPYKDKPSLK